jgi:hypothetical protein
LRKEGKIRDILRKFKLDEINQEIALLKQGRIIGMEV